MTTYYVATLVCNVLVEAESEDEARRLGHAALTELMPERRAPIEIRIVRPATAREIALQRLHDEDVAAQKRMDSRQRG